MQPFFVLFLYMRTVAAAAAAAAEVNNAPLLKHRSTFRQLLFPNLEDPT